MLTHFISKVLGFLPQSFSEQNWSIFRDIITYPPLLKGCLPLFFTRMSQFHPLLSSFLRLIFFPIYLILPTPPINYVNEDNVSVGQLNTFTLINTTCTLAKL